MEDLQVALNSARVDQKNHGLWIRAWHVGQTLQALVVDKSPTKGMLLRVDGHQFAVASDIPAQKGARLMLEVTHMLPTPTLKLIQVNNSPLGAAPVINFAVLSELSQKLTNQVRGLLPRQGKTDKALLSLMGLKSDDEDLIDVNLTESLKRLIPENRHLKDGQHLSQALRRIGSFSNAGSDNPNLSQLLQRFLIAGDVEQSMSSNSDIQPDINRALAKLALNQAGSMQALESDQASYYFDLPLWFSETLVVAEIQLIDRSESGVQRWHFHFQIEVPDMGVVQARIYFNEQTISVTVSSNHEDFLRVLGQNAADLEQQLVALGLKVSAICCQSEVLSTPSVTDHFADMLDEKA